MSFTNTQLTKASNFDVNNLVFSQPQTAAIPNSKPPINYKRINISVKNSDGSTGDLVLETERLFSFGVSANRNPETQAINGYVMPLCLWNRDGASPAEKQFTDVFNDIVEKCKDHLIQEKDEIEKYDLDMAELKKFNPLYWKRERGKIVSGTGPTLYCKLIVSKKDGYEKIISVFWDGESGDQVDPMQLQGKYCYVKAAVKIESIFIGNKCSLQIKLWEAEVNTIEKGMKRLLKPSGNPIQSFRQSLASTPEIEIETEVKENVEDIQSVGSVEDSDEDFAAPPPKKDSPAATVKKNVRARKR